MRRRLHSLKAAADIPGIRLVDGVVGARVRATGRTKHSFCLRRAIRLPYVPDIQHGQHDALAVAQGNLALAGVNFLANSSVTSSVIGTGQSVPLARRMLWHTPS